MKEKVKETATDTVNPKVSPEKGSHVEYFSPRLNEELNVENGEDYICLKPSDNSELTKYLGPGASEQKSEEFSTESRFDCPISSLFTTPISTANATSNQPVDHLYSAGTGIDSATTASPVDNEANCKQYHGNINNNHFHNHNSGFSQNSEQNLGATHNLFPEFQNIIEAAKALESQHFRDSCKNFASLDNKDTTISRSPGNFNDTPPAGESPQSENAYINAAQAFQENEKAMSPGEVLVEREMALPAARGQNSPRKRRREPKSVRSPLQRKEDHLNKEKERRLRQTQSYELLRNLIPMCDIKTDKANLLEVTVQYISYLGTTLGPKMDVINKEFLEEFRRKQNATH